MTPIDIDNVPFTVTATDSLVRRITCTDGAILRLTEAAFLRDYSRRRFDTLFSLQNAAIPLELSPPLAEQINR